MCVLLKCLCCVDNIDICAVYVYMCAYCVKMYAYNDLLMFQDSELQKNEERPNLNKALHYFHVSCVKA